MSSVVSLHNLDAGTGPVVVLLHGLFGAAVNLGIINRHLQKNHRVIAMDLRNHGSSPHASGMTYDRMIADVIHTLDEKGVDDFIIIGHSMGGKVSMRLALEHGKRVKALAVLDITPGQYPPAFRPYAEAMLGIPLDWPVNRRDADAFLESAVPDPRIRGFLLQNFKPGDQPFWRIGLQEIADGLPDIEGWVTPENAVYTGPTVFIAGADSNYIRPEHTPILNALFPNHTMDSVPNAGHWLHADNAPGTLETIERFFTANEL